MMGSGMSNSIDEILARHDAATACGCSCCDDDYCAYVERQRLNTRADNQPDEALPSSAASQRRSLRYVFETLLGWKAPVSR